MMNDGAAMKKFETAARKLERTIAELAEGPADRKAIEASTMRALDRLVRMTDVAQLGSVEASDAAYARWTTIAAARIAACERGSRLARERGGARADMLAAPAAVVTDIALAQFRKELAVGRCG